MDKSLKDRKMNWISIAFIWICLECLVFEQTMAFNLNTKYPKRFNGPQNSYFGFSLKFHQKDSGLVLLVGAPKANQSYAKEVNSPGTIFSCPLSGNDCEEVTLEQFGNGQGKLIHSDDNTYYRDVKDEGWMGVTIDSRHDGMVVTCGHRWMNAYLYYRDYMSNGMCYTLNKNLNSNTLTRLIPLIEKNLQVINQGVPNYAFGMAGLVAHFPKELNQLILGAPGVLQWDGSILNIPNPHVPSQSTMRWGPRDNRESNTKFSYFGYSVSSGKFHSDDYPVSYVVGAPRFNYYGKVYIIRSLYNRFEIKQRFFGEKQMGEYFGAVVCPADIDNDGFDDLLVGAPLYKAEVREEGTVYFFQNLQTNSFLDGIRLSGSSIAGARFGMAISSVGDLNGDKYNDVIIGAPFENENGAIYIYNGKKSGLSRTYSQKIIAEDINSNIRTFGASLSKGFDVDQNTYPEIAVGSYESDEVTLLFSQPPVKLIGILSFLPSKINVRNPACTFGGVSVRCFNITACLARESTLTLKTIKVDTILELDASYLYKKRVIMFSEGKNVTSIKETIDVGKAGTCKIFKVLVLENVQDFIQPIVVKYSFTLSPNPSKDIRYVPVLDPSSPTFITNQIYFLRGCGTDDRCDSDLELDAWFVLSQESRSKKLDLILGTNNTLTIHAVVKNVGEPAYLTRLNITVPQWGWFEHTPHQCKETFRMSHIILLCDLGNPLEKENSIRLHMNIENMKSSDFAFNLEASTISNEVDLKKNIVQLHGKVRTEADVAIVGTSNVEFVSYHNLLTSLDHFEEFSHKYEIWNLGPSPVEEVLLEIEIPIADSRNKEKNFMEILMIENKNGRAGSYFGECKRSSDKSESIDNGPLGVTLPPPVKRRRRSVQNSDSDSKRSKLDCGNSECETITCSIFKLKARDSVFITIKMSVNLKIIHNIKINEDIIDFYTRGKIAIINPKSVVQPPKHQPDEAKVKVSFDTGRIAMQEWPDWIIPVSIILGVLLILLIMFALYKIGFFRREQREKLERLMHTAEVEAADTTDDQLDKQLINNEDEDTTK